jgi:Dit-like phage tail protein
MIIVDGFIIDCSLNETHTLNSEATEFPVESGADLTDHIRQLPVEVLIEGMVSDTPIGAMATIRDGEALTLGEGEIADAVLPSDAAIAHLERIWSRRQPVTIQTGLGARRGSSGGKVYERMAMTELEIPRDPATGNAVRFTAKFRQINIVTNERTTVPTATPGGSGKRKLGTKPVVGTDVPAGSTLVFTIRRAPSGTTGGFTATNGVQYAGRPEWLEGDPGVPVSVDSFGDHFNAGPGQQADGYVLNFKYTPFKRAPLVMPATGGGLQKDESGRIWHSYPVQKPPADPNAPVTPDTAGETNAQYWNRVYGKAIPGL